MKTLIAIALLTTVLSLRLARAQECYVDLVFIVDQSGSICEDKDVKDCEHWRDLKRFLVNVVNSLDIGLKKTRVGLVTFRTSAEVRFRLDDYTTRGDVINAINAIDYTPWGMTNLAEGISVARKKVFNDYGDRPTVKNIAIVITDGKPTVSSGKTIPEADEAKKQGIRILCVGVTNSVDNSTLQYVSSSPQRLDQNFFLTPNWNGLQNVFRDLVRSACTQSQELQGCAVIELVFLVEMSDAVCRGDAAYTSTGGRECDRWDRILDFMLSIVNNLQIGNFDVKVSLITFSNVAEIHFKLNDFTDKLSLTQELRKLEYKPRGSVNTADAIRVARVDVLKDARIGTRKVIIMLTSSRPTANSQEVATEASRSRNIGIETFAIGIGSSIDDNTLSLVSSGSQRQGTDWFRVNSHAQLPDTMEDLLDSACSYEEPPPANDDSEGCARVDLVFVVDESGSICDFDDEWRTSGKRRCGNWNRVITFLTDSVQSLSIGRSKVQVGLIRFRTETTLEWNLSVYGDKNSLLEAIRGLDYHGGGQTYTADALKMMRTQMFGADDDRPTARNVAIVITDGVPTKGSQAARTLPEAALARKEGIQLFVVGVTDLIDKDILMGISSLPQEEDRNYFTSPDFEGLSGVLDSVMKSACSPLESCTKDVDVAIALDTSGSIGKTNFATMIEFARSLVRQMRIGRGTRVSLVTFNDTAQVQFYLNSYDSGDDILSILGKIPYYGGTTNTFSALRLIKEEVFNDRNGDRLSNTPNVVIIITDGKSNDEHQTWMEACELRKRDIHLMAVGVGSESNPDELRSVASFPADLNVYQADNFDDLARVAYYLGVAMCNDLDECNSDPCRNGGQCQDKISGFFCECPRFYTGPNCERECSGDADLLFIIDRSGSIPHEHFNHVKEFIVQLAGKFEMWKEKVRLAALAFHDDYETIFDFNTYKNIRNVEEAIRHIEYKGGETNIASALQGARTQIFHSSTGDRRDVPNYVIMFTDGEANNREADTIPQGVELRMAGVHVITVGVGKHINMDHLRGIASWPTSENIFNVQAWHQLDTLINPTVEATCDDTNECLSNPCQNGGTCVDGLGQYLCVCRGDRSGRNCERTCTMRMDVLFIVDISGSPEHLYDSAMMFVREIVHGLEFRGDTAKVALMTYSKKVTTLFNFNKYKEKNDILDAISFPRSGGNTNMQSALSIANSEIFQSQNGDRNGIANKVILLTDGCSDIQSGNTIPRANELKNEAKADVHVIAIGNRVDMQEAEAVATSKDEPYLIKVAQSGDVTAGAQRLLDHMCKR